MRLRRPAPKRLYLHRPLRRRPSISRLARPHLRSLRGSRRLAGAHSTIVSFSSPGCGHRRLVECWPSASGYTRNERCTWNRDAVRGAANASTRSAGDFNRGGAPVGPPPTASGAASSAVAAPAPIPVSAARAERDAAARALRRSDHDPIEVARRIAAALNVGPKDPRFMWLTALTKDGSIVVANNYGLAYIPENVKLPEQVKFASADESISRSSAERGQPIRCWRCMGGRRLATRHCVW